MLSKSRWRTNFMIYSDTKQSAMLAVTWERLFIWCFTGGGQRWLLGSEPPRGLSIQCFPLKETPHPLSAQQLFTPSQAKHWKLGWRCRLNFNTKHVSVYQRLPVASSVKSQASCDVFIPKHPQWGPQTCNLLHFIINSETCRVQLKPTIKKVMLHKTNSWRSRADVI